MSLIERTTSDPLVEKWGLSGDKETKLLMPDYEIDNERYVVLLKFDSSTGGLYEVSVTTGGRSEITA
jgi:hypothetical protein